MFKLTKAKSHFRVLKRFNAALTPNKVRPPLHAPIRNSRLKETSNFGPNPGQLRMFSYIPRALREQAPLVVVLHGCGQTATDYDLGAGWSSLADRFGFALLLPEQQRSNNPNGCFNWFEIADAQRGRGEAASIFQMVDAMVRRHNIDPRRVSITGLSAGGAMTSVMLACYPETFSAGAIIAGLPYGAASNVQQALQSMFQSPARPEKVWGDLVRRAAPHGGPWPRVSIWHGDADKTVIPSNARESQKQWLNVHGLPLAPSYEGTVEGYPHKVWRNGAGEILVESYVITGMSHGTPVATDEAERSCGNVGPFFLEAGISSSAHIAEFFGVTRLEARQSKWVSKSENASSAQPPSSRGSRATDKSLIDAPIGSNRARPVSRRSDVGAIISAALEKAGLLVRR